MRKNLYFIPDYYDSFYLYILRLYGGTKKSYPLFRSQVAKNIRCRLKPRIFFQAVISERI